MTGRSWRLRPLLAQHAEEIGGDRVEAELAAAIAANALPASLRDTSGLSTSSANSLESSKAWLS